MTSKWRALVDHEQIRRWAKERGAQPSTVRRTPEDDSAGTIRLDFPGSSGQGSLEEISWDEWFRHFDENDLALIVEDEMANGQSHNFNKLVARENLEDYSDQISTRGANKKASSRMLTTVRSRKTSDQRSPKATGSSKRTTVKKRPNREQPSERSTSGHKPRRKAA